MVSIPFRMRKLKTLLDIRLGPGAVVMPPTVQRIHMLFAKKINNGHMGPRKFWRTYLPRLKYHNPAVPMTVEQTTDQLGPASMLIHFAASNPADPASKTTISTINMKHKNSDDILGEFMNLTRGVRVEATPEEQAELQELEDERVRAETDRVRAKKELAEQRKQAALLARAKSLGV